MASIILSSVGAAIGSRVAGAGLSTFASILGRAAGQWIGGRIDQALFGESRAIEGPRLNALHLQASIEGASIPVIYGRARVAGQVIWAARFRETVTTEEVETSGGKGGGGASTSVTSYAYSLSFAVGLCEGEIARIGRVWANGALLDLSAYAHRVHRGTEAQAPDPLIEAIEGEAFAPAYRGLAYVVFEDFPLADFGNTPPQLSFEIIRPAPGAFGPRLEDRIKGVCLIPGAGEFVYATEPVRRQLGLGREAAENVHAARGVANFKISLNQLEADLPQCRNVLLVTAWFGTDLRMGVCAIKPGVERAAKSTTPILWSAGAVTRAGAHLISEIEGGPAYGGTPADATIVAAIQELKARGFKVGLYPFILMDVPAGNALPDPYGEAEQGAYPWRGRITLHPAPGSPGTPDKTSAASAQVNAFFGAAAPGDFTIVDGAVAYGGPAEWSFRRFILHNAKLAALAGGVDAFILGSELRGITSARDSAVNFPAVAKLRALATDVRAMLGAETKLTYAADWSEYGGHRPQDGTGDVFFHLDPLWADSAIDCVGVDWYPPLSDWREGASHLDAALARTDHDSAYLKSRIEAGENYHWYYADDAARAAQARTPITDGAYDEPWVFRAKDLRGFWSNAHHNRPGGVRNAAPTAWIARSKPIWLIELGCPAIDKGANAPNLFLDPKSSESAAPPFSTGAPDDLIQRRTLEAYLEHWDGLANPISSLYGAGMIDPDGVFIWCWDARPFPEFPARADVWSDGDQWRRGHWLNGRAGLAMLGEVVADLCLRGGVVDIDAAQVSGLVAGYVVDSPATPRAALEPLMAAFDFSVSERDGALVFAHGADAQEQVLDLDDVTADVSASAYRLRADPAAAPIEARIRYIDPVRDYALGAVSARRRDAAEGGVETLDAPLVLEEAQARDLAERLLARRRAEKESVTLAISPARLALEAGDRLAFAGGVFEVARIEDGAARTLDLVRADAGVRGARFAPIPSAPVLDVAPTPALAVLDLPLLPGYESDERPLAALAADPWRGAHRIYVGADLGAARVRARAERAATMGTLLWDLYPGPLHRWDEGNVVRVELIAGALAGVTREALFAGANVFAVEGDGEWEILQARNAALVAPNTYELSGFLRGLCDTGHAMGAPTPAGRRIVKLDAALARVPIGAHEFGQTLAFLAPAQDALLAGAAAARIDAAVAPRARRPFRPVHPRARAGAGGDIELAWIRQSRRGGDFWGEGEVPLAEGREAYLVEILDGSGAVRRGQTVEAPGFVYTAAAQTLDFGAPLSGSIRFRAAQIGADGLPGLKTESTIPL